VDLEVALVHAQIEALRLAYADTAYYLGDPDAEQIPTDDLLEDTYAARRAALFQPARALAHVPRGAPREDSCTVSWQVVDADGNAVSAVQSNYLGFGTGIVPSGCGFTLQNRGLNFSTLDGVPNALRPGVRPYHTILPALVTDAASGELVASLTNMGGYMQPQGHVQLVCRLVRRGLCPQEAVDLPRFCVLPMFPGTAPCSPAVAVEDTFRPEVVAGLRALGHTLTLVSGSQRTVVGRAQVIMRAANGVLWGASDGRADGMAAGR
jgi:gamma-glutamyltranspeptidase/glutathione hydrolase